MAPALTLMGPAFPVLPVFAFEAIPVEAPGVIAPSIVSPPATMTETLPLLPGPKVLLEMLPLLRMDKPPALTKTLPPLPDPDVAAAISPLLTIDKDPAL